MGHKKLVASPLTVDTRLLGRPLASPLRRLCSLVLDAMLLFLPSVALAVVAVLLSLQVSNPGALDAIASLFSARSRTGVETARILGALAPVLVQAEAEGLPPSVAIAVNESDLQKAGEILAGYSIDITMTPGDDASPLPPGHIRLEAERLIPRVLRSAALFGVAALYFTFFASGRRSATIGKLAFGIRVQRLDGRPLTWWESFERFGGYLASLGTLGVGLLDLWRDPNRRLAHDRISNTVVVLRRTQDGGRESDECV